MSTQAKAAILAAVVAIVFVVLQLTLGVQTGIAGIFVMGMAAGLWIGLEMAKRAVPAALTH